MLKYTLILPIIISLLVFSGCREETQVTNIQNQWSGLNPTSIPLTVRLKEEEKGNLVTNPSFELGKLYTVDSTVMSFNVPGWKKVGDNVVWTNIENKSEFESDEASLGNHAIRIFREKSNETETMGEGIMTDYIRVIPGNYSLNFDIRLEHIRSNLDRLGTGIFDAVNIRVYCYDRNKVMIKNVAYHPLYNKEIDNSFKGFSFSNHDEIDKFGWARISGRSGNFPFEEGNLPEETRYVKIFAGLKGEGKMWVDRFEFRYSSKNFTLREKLEPYFDTTLERSAYLIPRPRRTAYYRSMPLLVTDQQENELFPRILLPENPDDQIEQSLLQFASGMNEPEGRIIELLEDLDNRDLDIPSLIFSVGINELSSQLADQLPFQELEDKSQAYFLKRLDQFSNVIFFGYSDTEGLQHGLHTLRQLIDTRENLYHHYDILDYPDFNNRGVIIKVEKDTEFNKDWSADFKSLCALGVNTWITEPEMDSEQSISFFTRNNPWLDMDFSSLGFPYIRRGVSLENLIIPESKASNDTKQYQEDILNFADQLYQGLERLNSRNMDMVVFSDRTLWESMNFSPAGGVLMNDENFNRFMFYRNLFSQKFSSFNHEELPLSYLIPFYRGVSRKENLYYDIYSGVIADSTMSNWFNSVLWSGPVKNASMIDFSDLYGLRNSDRISLLDYSFAYQTGSNFYGNYYSLYPGKALTGVLFRPYDTRITGIDPEYFNSEVFLKVNDFSEVTRIRLSTAMDFFWNNALYDPAFSLWKVLLHRYDKDVAMEIVLFNDIYFKLLSISLNMELNGYNQKHDKQASELIIQLNSHWDKLQELLSENIEFLNELSDMKNSIISRYYQAQKNSKKPEVVE